MAGSGGCAKARRPRYIKAFSPTEGPSQEYGAFAVNHQEGCSYACDYCFSKDISKRRGNKNFHDQPYLRPGFIDHLRKQAAKRRGINNRVVVSITSDCYQPLDDELRATRQVLEILRDNDIPFVVLSKGGLRATRDLDLFRPGIDAFAATLTHLDAERSREREPFAAPPEERIAALRMAHEMGVFTWVSLEPVLDADVTLRIIEETHTFVDHLMIGKLNHGPSTIDWRDFGIRAVGLCERLGASYYVKEALREYLNGVIMNNTDVRTIRRSEAGTASSCTQ